MVTLGGDWKGQNMRRQTPAPARPCNKSLWGETAVAVAEMSWRRKADRHTHSLQTITTNCLNDSPLERESKLFSTKKKTDDGAFTLPCRRNVDEEVMTCVVLTIRSSFCRWYLLHMRVAARGTYYPPQFPEMVLTMDGNIMIGY